MRILYLTHRLPYAANRGDRIRGYHVLRHLASRHQVDLLSLVHDEDEAAHVGDFAGIADSVTVARVGRVRQARRAAQAVFAGQPLTHALLDAAGFDQALRKLVAERPPDAVLALCSGMARYALEPPLAGRPFVLDMVDVDSEKWRTLGQKTGGVRGWIYRREAVLLGQFERTATGLADTTLVVNDRERESLQSLSECGRIAVVPNGVELSGFRPETPPASEPRVVFCGVLNYQPNETAARWLAQEVWPLVRQVRPDARLTLLGAHPTRRIARLAEQDSSIEVTGSVPDVRPFLWRSAISVAPLQVARGVQNKVLEAVAAQLPTVVSTAVFEGLPSEVVPACVRADTAEMFATQITMLLAMSPTDRRSLACRATLAPLTWSRQLARLGQILESAAGAQRRTA